MNSLFSDQQVTQRVRHWWSSFFFFFSLFSVFCIVSLVTLNSMRCRQLDKIHGRILRLPFTWLMDMGFWIFISFYFTEFGQIHLLHCLLWTYLQLQFLFDIVRGKCFMSEEGEKGGWGQTRKLRWPGWSTAAGCVSFEFIPFINLLLRTVRHIK